MLFTRDLRVRDHCALTAAVRESEEILPLFVLDEALLGSSCGSPNRVSYLLDSLRDLERSLAERGALLVVRRGDVVAEAIGLAREWNARAIHMSADVTPYARERERRLARACAGARVELRTHPGVTVVPAGALTPAGAHHYRVFTPYWRVWRSVAAGSPLPAPRRIAVPHDLIGAGAHELTREARPDKVAGGGERKARASLQRWLRSDAGRYGESHDDLAHPATSRLGPALHFGCISPRTVLARTAERSEDFARQLCWRDFHHQVLAANPTLPRADYRPRRMPWREDQRQAEAWRGGRTGYPIVDAGMRQLESEGFMHNRARLIVASFLTKTLALHWRIGAAHFAGLLADADVANNVGNWQWVAGTGNDTRPNRILNPLRQAARFDPHGDYVRRHLPALAGVPGAAVHAPWRLPPSLRRTLDYPDRIVDHDVAAREAPLG